MAYLLKKLDDPERAKFLRQVGVSLPQRIELVAAIITRPDCETCNGTGSAQGVVFHPCLMNWNAPFAGLA